MDEFLDVADQLRKVTPDKDFDLVFRGIDALQAVLSKATMDLINLESVFAAFEMAALLGGLKPLTAGEMFELPAAMARLIQRTLETTITFPATSRSVSAPSPYDEIASIVATSFRGNPAGRVSFISFNYDVCLDFALYGRSLVPEYCLETAANVFGRIRVLKLHGSLNWTLCPDCKKVVPWHLSEFFKGRSWPLWDQPRQVKLGIATELTKFRHCGSQHAREPFLAPPTWNKTLHHRQLETVWKAAAEELSTAENILVCGYSLPETDQFFRYLFALGSVSHVRLKRFWVINPNREVEARFQQLCGQSTASRFRFFPLLLQNATDCIREVLPEDRH